MYASYIGHDHVVSQLLENGACVNIKNNKGQTPLCLAASCGNCNVSELLLQVSYCSKNCFINMCIVLVLIDSISSFLIVFVYNLLSLCI